MDQLKSMYNQIVELRTTINSYSMNTTSLSQLELSSTNLDKLLEEAEAHYLKIFIDSSNKDQYPERETELLERLQRVYQFASHEVQHKIQSLENLMMETRSKAQASASAEAERSEQSENNQVPPLVQPVQQAQQSKPEQAPNQQPLQTLPALQQAPQPVLEQPPNQAPQQVPQQVPQQAPHQLQQLAWQKEVPLVTPEEVVRETSDQRNSLIQPSTSTGLTKDRPENPSFNVAPNAPASMTMDAPTYCKFDPKDLAVAASLLNKIESAFALSLMQKNESKIETSDENLISDDESESGDPILTTNQSNDLSKIILEKAKALSAKMSKIKTSSGTRSRTKANNDIVPEGEAEEEVIVEARDNVDTQAPQVTLKLDTMRLPTFDGDLTQWISFRDQYLVMVHNNANFSAITKFHQLKTHLRGLAADAINGFKLTANDYEAAWYVLTRRYDQKDRIIDEYLRQFDEMPALQYNKTPAQIINLVNRTNQLLRVLPSLGIKVKDWGSMLSYRIRQKMDPQTKRKWIEQVKKREGVPLTELLEFLEVEAFECASIQTESSQKSNKFDKFKTQKKQNKPTSMMITLQQTCPQCKGNHPIFRCRTFLALSVADRLQKIKQTKLCTTCLNHHNADECKFGSCPTCDKPHNSLLCFKREKEKKSAGQNKKRASDTPAQVTNVMINHTDEMNIDTQRDTSSILGTTRAIVSNANPWNNSIRALCDNGSQLNLITQKAVKRLGLVSEQFKLGMTGAQDQPISDARGRVVVSIIIPGTNQFLKATMYVVQKISRHMPFYKPKTSYQKEFENLKLADPSYAVPGEVDALFGVGIWLRILESGVVKTLNENAAAQQTKLGWVIYQVEPEIDRKESAFVATILKPPSGQQENLDQLLSKFWEIEDLPKVKRRTPDEIECERIFTSGVERASNGRYIVRLPFNDKINLLGRSKNSALSQFYAMERKMHRDKSFHDAYVKFMQEYIDLKHMTEVDLKSDVGYFTPHHGVVSSGKFRVVFNASSPTTTGISLNQCQLTGEKLQNDLAITLMQFRFYKYAITADVVKMFRQIEVHEDDRKYQKILWRNNRDEPVKVYQLNTVTYGQTAAPHLSVRTMQQCAYDYQDKYSIGAYHTLKSFYVDDLLGGADTCQEVMQIHRELIALMAEGKFELAKWCSNNNGINKSIQAKPVDREIKEVETKSVLGLRWSPETDTFSYKVEPIEPEENWTKRKILSRIGKLYDPNGFISPIVIVAKCIMQDLWKNEHDWDEPVSDLTLVRWEEFISTLPKLEAIKIPRWLGTSGKTKTILHGFCDASENAYAAVVYLCTVNSDGIITANLLESKTRVAPLKQLSIPRLELCGAHLLAKLVKSIYEVFGEKLGEGFLWTDSEVTLQWINKHPSTLKTFVGNRVASIQHETTDKGLEWHWTPGVENPADIASRGASPQQLKNHPLWWHGPSWILASKEKWPKRTIIEQDNLEETLEETKTVNLITKAEIFTRGRWFKDKNSTETPLLETYGDYFKLRNVVATVHRAVENFRRKVQKLPLISGPLLPDEKEKARFTLIRLEQEKFFGKDLQDTIENEKFTPKGNYHWFDNNSRVLRLAGRLYTEEFDKEALNPAIIPHDGTLAKLIIRHVHKKTLHGGVQQILYLIRTKYWIPKLRRLIRTVIYSCPTCFRYKMKMRTQLMAPLPPERTKLERPFTNCGVDYMGPVGLSSKVGRNPIIVKAYVAVFVCFATRAIHLELVSDASTNQFLQALRRTIARRGMIRSIWSDNGTNFHGANNFLKQIEKASPEWYSEIQKITGIQWHFATPNAPHHGGIYEAAVKSSKKHLIRVIGDTNLTFEEYATLLAQVEACVNSRPLTQLNDDPLDVNALTPGHFLIGESLITLMEHKELEFVNVSYLRRWEMIQQMYQNFWKRWHNEYVLTLIDRTKWKSRERDLRVGDLVIIKEENVPPSRWRLGRILETYQGRDGCVRSVRVKTQTGNYNRPITRLGLLISNDEISNAEKEQEIERPKQPARKRQLV